MMYFASIARMSSICLSESLAPLALMDCQAPSNAAIKVLTASGSNTQSTWIVEEVTHFAPSRGGGRLHCSYCGDLASTLFINHGNRLRRSGTQRPQSSSPSRFTAAAGITAFGSSSGASPSPSITRP
jgi:hypothetical protein